MFCFDSSKQTKQLRTEEQKNKSKRKVKEQLQDANLREDTYWKNDNP